MWEVYLISKVYWLHSYWLLQKGSISTKILHHALVYIKFSIPDAMSFEILLKFVKVFWYTSYFFIFWQVVRVSNMKKQQNFFKPVPSHIVTDNFFYLEACGNHLASIYQLHILLQPMRVWNHCCHVSEYNVQSYSLEIISKQHFKHLKLSCCCLPLMLLGFPFLTLHIFHNKLFLMKNLDTSILCVLQHSVFPDFTFFVLVFFLGGSST